MWLCATSLNNEEQRARLDRVPFAGVNLGDHSVAAGAHLVLHLHRFDDDERLTGVDDIAGLDEDANHLARHRRRQTLRRRARSPALVAAAEAALAIQSHRYGHARDG